MQNMKKEDLKKKAYIAPMVGVCYVDVEHQMLAGSDFSGGHKTGGAGGDLGDGGDSGHTGADGDLGDNNGKSGHNDGRWGSSWEL